MTNFVKNLGIAAAAMVVTAGMACAQSLKVDVPFAFQVGNKALPAGTYSVTRTVNNSAPVFAIQTVGAAVLIMAGSRGDANRAWKDDGQARLAFECGSSCALRQLWTGGDAPVYSVGHRKSADINTHIAVVVMRPDKGD